MSQESKPTMSWASMMEEEDEEIRHQRPPEPLGRKEQESRAHRIALEHKSIEEAEKRRILQEDRKRKEQERVQRLNLATPERTRREFPALSPWKVPPKEAPEKKQIEEDMKQLQQTVHDIQEKVRQDISFVVRRMEDEEKLRDEKLNAYSKKEDLDRRILQDKLNKQQDELTRMKTQLEDLKKDRDDMKLGFEKEKSEIRQELKKEFREQIVTLKEDFQNSLNTYRKEIQDEISKESQWKVVPPRTRIPEEKPPAQEIEYKRKEKFPKQWRKAESPKTETTRKSPGNPPKTQ